MDVVKKTIDAIRIFSAEGVESAKSGHPGMPMGTAPIAYTLWADYLKHNPSNPKWDDRDRFVLSAGHGSMLIYSLLHLFGYGLTTDDLGNFRQLDSLTPGHPEYGHTVGIETTTGPLGQGFATAVGMAIAETYLGAKFNKPNYAVVDHYTYVLSGDGCMMEGITSEAASMAGTLALDKLIVFYDDNEISIEGDTDISFREDVGKRFEAYNWHVITVEDANDTAAIGAAIESAKAENTKPSIIIVQSIIGYGCPNLQGKEESHGAPLGTDNLKATKECLGWESDEFFTAPSEVYAHTAAVAAKGADAENTWNDLFASYKAEFPELADEYKLWMSGDLAVDLLNNDDYWSFDEATAATRNSSSEILNRLAKIVPNLIGGSADLAPSTKTIMKGAGDYSADNRSGANLHFGVREHAMGAAGNGLALHGGLKPYVSTFFVFTDYMKSSMRMSAMMGLPNTYVLTHDSIGVGEDGPTHQPIEQLTAARSIPGFTIWRPCDSKEVAAGWYLAMTKKDGPMGLVLSRQNLPLLDETGKGALKGGYILKDSEGDCPDIILMASGSEVELIYNAWDVLKEKGIDARVVSMPSMEIYDEQDDDYKESVLPSGVRARLAVEAGSGMPWHKYTGLDGDIISMETFGASGPYSKLVEKFGFTLDNVTAKAEALVKP